MVTEERATVVAVTGDRATVELDASTACGSCGLCASAGGGHMRLEVAAVQGLEPGQTVLIALDRSLSLRSIFFVFGLPLLGLVAGAAIGYSCPIPGLSADVSAILLAVALLALAYLAAIIYDRKVASKTTTQPTIVRIEPK